MKGLKYYLNEIRKNWRNRRWWKSKIVEKMEKVLHPLQLCVIGGSYVLDEDWDHLIILDAYRYDVFEEALKNWNIKGKLEYRISRGSNTAQFLREDFNRNNAEKDIIYITANPVVEKKIVKKCKIVSLWLKDRNEELGTVLPEVVYRKAIEVTSKNHDKRIIYHFLQPHNPYLKFEERYVRLNSDDIWAYKENLKIVMPYVKKLCKILPGKVVVTSDHEEAFGEKIRFFPIKIYGHPAIGIKPLIKVPWFSTENDIDYTNVLKELTRLNLRRIKHERKI